jgi:hypothetical protein
MDASKSTLGARRPGTDSDGHRQRSSAGIAHAITPSVGGQSISGQAGFDDAPANRHATGEPQYCGNASRIGESISLASAKSISDANNKLQPRPHPEPKSVAGGLADGWQLGDARRRQRSGA